MSGTSRVARPPASQSPSWAPAALAPPAASTVVITASAWPSSSIRPGSGLRSEPQKTGRAVAPRSVMAAQSVSTNPVLPDNSCAR